jgi:RNA recognition motif-containing protein
MKPKLFVCNLPYEIGVPELYDLFGKYGRIQYVQILLDGATNRSRGRALVTFRFAEDAERAIAELNESTFAGRRLICIQARPPRKAAIAADLEQQDEHG